MRTLQVFVALCSAVLLMTGVGLAQTDGSDSGGKQAGLFAGMFTGEGSVQVLFPIDVKFEQGGKTVSKTIDEGKYRGNIRLIEVPDGSDLELLLTVELGGAYRTVSLGSCHKVQQTMESTVYSSVATLACYAGDRTVTDGGVSLLGITQRLEEYQHRFYHVDWMERGYDFISHVLGPNVIKMGTNVYYIDGEGNHAKVLSQSDVFFH